MDRYGGAFLRKAFSMVLSSPLALTKLFWSLVRQAIDIESQTTTSSAAEHEIWNDYSSCISDHQSQSGNSVARQAQASTVECDDSLRAETYLNPQYASELCRIIAYSEDSTKGNMALTITEGMVSRIQSVLDNDQELKKQEKAIRRLEKDISAANSKLESIEDAQFVARENEEEDAFEGNLVRQRMTLEDCMQRRNILISDLEIFKMNLECARQASQRFFEEILGQAGLLNNLCEASESDETSMVGIEQELETAESDADEPAPTELLRRSTYEKLIQASQDVQEAHGLFDDLDAKCEREEAMYYECVAMGEYVPPKSVFDRMFLNNKMELTRYMIKAEKEYEEERVNAIALGVVASDWGVPSEYGSLTASNSPEDDLVRANERDYTSVRSWLTAVTMCEETMTTGMDIISEYNECHTDPENHYPQDVPDPMEVDDWDAKTVEISDSISLIDFDSDNVKALRRWQEMKGHK